MGCLCKVVDMCRGFATLSAHTCLKTDNVNWKKVRLCLICETNYCLQPRHSRLINYLAVCRRRPKLIVAYRATKSAACLQTENLLPCLLTPQRTLFLACRIKSTSPCHASLKIRVQANSVATIYDTFLVNITKKGHFISL